MLFITGIILDPRNPPLFDYISKDLNLDIAMVIGPVAGKNKETKLLVKVKEERDKITANREDKEKFDGITVDGWENEYDAKYHS